MAYLKEVMKDYRSEVQGNREIHRRLCGFNVWEDSAAVRFLLSIKKSYF